jgi:hypothetical protein
MGEGASMKKALHNLSGGNNDTTGHKRMAKYKG